MTCNGLVVGSCAGRVCFVRLVTSAYMIVATMLTNTFEKIEKLLIETERVC